MASLQQFAIENGISDTYQSNVRNKQLPTCWTQIKFAEGKLRDWEGCPLDKLKFINN